MIVLQNEGFFFKNDRIFQKTKRRLKKTKIKKPKNYRFLDRVKTIYNPFRVNY